MPEQVALMLNREAVPSSIDWNGRHYAVTDSPTRLDIDPIAMTHPLPGLVGWRFQGTDDRGQAYVFDIRRGPDGETWWLIHAYE